MTVIESFKADVIASLTADVIASFGEAICIKSPKPTSVAERGRKKAQMKLNKSNPNASAQILPRQGKYPKTKQLQTQTFPGRTPEANREEKAGAAIPKSRFTFMPALFNR